MKWRIVGAHRDSGEMTETFIDAPDRESAGRASAQRGVVIAHIEAVDEPAKPSPQPLRTSSPARNHAPGRVRDRFPLRWWVCLAFTIGVGILAGDVVRVVAIGTIAAIKQAADDWQKANARSAARDAEIRRQKAVQEAEAKSRNQDTAKPRDVAPRSYAIEGLRYVEASYWVVSNENSSAVVRCSLTFDNRTGRVVKGRVSVPVLNERGDVLLSLTEKRIDIGTGRSSIEIEEKLDGQDAPATGVVGRIIWRDLR